MIVNAIDYGYVTQTKSGKTRNVNMSVENPVKHHVSKKITFGILIDVLVQLIDI